jgi:hypothetical protein
MRLSVTHLKNAVTKNLAAQQQPDDFWHRLSVRRDKRSQFFCLDIAPQDGMIKTLAVRRSLWRVFLWANLRFAQDRLMVK